MNHDLIERHRDINVQGNWWSAIYSEFTADLFSRTGVSVAFGDIAFTGFWSQGDGACFITDHELLADFLLRVGWQDKYPALFADENATFAIYRLHSGRYSHSGTMHVSLDHAQDDWLLDEFIQAVEQARYEAACKEEDACTMDIKEFFRKEADNLYSKLEDAYDYLTSDEVVWDTLEANDMVDEDDEDEDEEEEENV